jgi:hypothetical protein
MNYYIIMWTSRFVTAVYICKQVALSTSNAFSVSCWAWELQWFAKKK